MLLYTYEIPKYEALAEAHGMKLVVTGEALPNGVFCYYDESGKPTAGLTIGAVLDWFAALGFDIRLFYLYPEISAKHNQHRYALVLMDFRWLEVTRAYITTPADALDVCQRWQAALAESPTWT